MTEFLTTIQFARLLRKNLTPEERIMWQKLRNRKWMGYKFLRQHPIKIWDAGGFYFYYADFYCAEKRLVVEIDGLIHSQQEDYDKSRDIMMLEFKMRVLRVTNEEVNNDLPVVMKKIANYLSSPQPFL